MSALPTREQVEETVDTARSGLSEQLLTLAAVASAARQETPDA